MEFKVEKLEREKGLALYLTANRNFYRYSWEDYSFIAIELSENEKFGSVALQKQKSIYEQHFSSDICYVFTCLTNQQRDVLVEKIIPFICFPNHLYLPFLGIMMSNRFKKKKRVNVEKMMPATQCLFLYLMYNREDHPIKKSFAAKKLNLTKTTITRASSQLVEMKLIREENHGTEIYMIPLYRGKTLYEKALPYLVNPIQKKVYVRQYNSDLCFLSGESALAQKTMLNHPKIQEYAIDKKKINQDELIEIDVQWENSDNVVLIQLWKYDPSLFSVNGVVDPISLAMTYKDNYDERIMGELETYLEEYEW